MPENLRNIVPEGKHDKHGFPAVMAREIEQPIQDMDARQGSLVDAAGFRRRQAKEAAGHRPAAAPQR